MSDLTVSACVSFCYLRTKRTVTCRPNTIEIWFAIECPILYMLSVGRD